MSDQGEHVFELPLFENLIIFAIIFSLASVVALWVSHYYARPGLSWVVRITVVLSYLFAFMALYVTSLDVTGSYHVELKPIWTTYYVLVSVGCWIIVPFQQAYHDNGGFTFKDKAIHSLKDEGGFYAAVLAVATIILGYIWLSTDLTVTDLWGLVLALANTYGFSLLTFFFGAGLVNLPLSVWKRANRDSGVVFNLYKLGKLNEKMQVEQDRLQQTNAYIDLLSNNCPTEFAPLLEIIRSKLPPPTAYEFAFIGVSTGIEAHGKLEKIQKLAFSDLKRKQFIALHYIVINHRRSLAILQSEWQDSIERYLYLEQMTTLKHSYPRSRDLPSDSFIQPGQATYSNFPGSFMWTLPCCCGEKNDLANTTTMFSQEQAGGTNLNDLSIKITSPHHNNVRDVELSEFSSSSTPIAGAAAASSSSMTFARGYSTDAINASTMEANNDIFDDMTSRNHTLSTVGMKYKEPTSARFTSWLFRKPPTLTPGTMYYRLTWIWYKFVVYFQPLALRFISLILCALSAVFMWSEIAIVISHKLSPMYYLTHLNVSPTALVILRILPLFYIAACVYYSIFHVNLGWWFHMQPRHRTSEHSMLASCAFLLRTIITTTYNYYQMCHIEGTAFLAFTGPMNVIPILGQSFSYVMPLFVALFAVLTIVNCWAWFLKLLGVPHFMFSMRSAESDQYVADGRLLIDRDQRRKGGEGVGYFRSRDIDGQKLKTQREERKKALGQEYVPKPKRESQALKAIQEREEREKQEQEQQQQQQISQNGSQGQQGNWNSKPMPNKYTKYHSQNQPKVSLDDF